MQKKLSIVALFLVLTLVLTGCACKHEWTEATCTLPKTCQKCEETEGEALGHTWVDADCVTPKTCSVCAETEGEALGHTFVDADCVTPKTCSVCAATEGEALGHTWVDAACVTPTTRSVCCATDGEALAHTWVDATCVAPKTCSVCAATEGEALGHTLEEQWTVSESALVKNCTVCGKAGETKELVATDGTTLKPVMLNESLVYVVPDGWSEQEYDPSSALWVNMEKGWGMLVADEEVAEDFTPEKGAEILSSDSNLKDVTLNENQNGEKYVRYSATNDLMHAVYFFGADGKAYQLLFLRSDIKPEDEGKTFLELMPANILEDEDFLQIIDDIVNNVFVVR